MLVGLVSEISAPERSAWRFWMRTSTRVSNGRFDARASYNYKDAYVESIGYEMYPIMRDGYGQLDISLSYRLSDRAQISLKGINMTDEATTGYTMDPSFPTMYELSGRRISVGLRYEF